MDPASPLSPCSRAASISCWRTSSRNATATSAIMIGPPMNSAKVNCHASSSAMMMPSSMTKLVLAISKAIAAVKLAPRRNRVRASATAAYEHEEDPAPKAVARASAWGLSSPSSRAMVSRRTTACTTADNVNPRISDQVICQVIDPAVARARPIASSTVIACLAAARQAQKLGQAVLQQLVREAVRQPVKHHPAVLAEAAQPGQPQHLQRVRHLVLGNFQRQRQVTHAQLPSGSEGEQDPGAYRVGQDPQQLRELPGLVGREPSGPGGGNLLGVDRVDMIERRHHYLRISVLSDGYTGM